jgi:hypothetical protein
VRVIVSTRDVQLWVRSHHISISNKRSRVIEVRSVGLPEDAIKGHVEPRSMILHVVERRWCALEVHVREHHSRASRDSYLQSSR